MLFGWPSVDSTDDDHELSERVHVYDVIHRAGEVYRTSTVAEKAAFSLGSVPKLPWSWAIATAGTADPSGTPLTATLRGRMAASSKGFEHHRIKPRGAKSA